MKRNVAAALATAAVVGGIATFLLLVASGNTGIAPPGYEWSEGSSMWCTVRPQDAGPNSLAGDVCISPSPESASSFVRAGLIVTLGTFAVVLLVRALRGKAEPSPVQ